MCLKAHISDGTGGFHSEKCWLIIWNRKQHFTINQQRPATSDRELDELSDEVTPEHYMQLVSPTQDVFRVILPKCSIPVHCVIPYVNT